MRPARDDDTVGPSDATMRHDCAEPECARAGDDRSPGERLRERTYHREHDHEEHEQSPSGSIRQPPADRLRAPPRLRDRARHRCQWQAEPHVQQRVVGHCCVFQSTKNASLPIAQRGVPCCRSAASHLRITSPSHWRPCRPGVTSVVLPPARDLKPSREMVPRRAGEQPQCNESMDSSGVSGSCQFFRSSAGAVAGRVPRCSSIRRREASRRSSPSFDSALPLWM